MTTPVSHETPRSRFCPATGAGLALLTALAACGDDAAGVPDTVPRFDASAFTSPLVIVNPYSPLTPNTASIYLEAGEDGPELIVVEVLEQTKDVFGITTRVVRDRVFRDGLLFEDTSDFYAQDDAGNVWYMGEVTEEFTYDDNNEVIESSAEGSWEAGVDGALPGYLMLAAPEVGRTYHQEWYPGHAEDIAEVLSLDATVDLADGTSYVALQTRDYSTLDPDADEHKYYAEGLGAVKMENADGSSPGEFLGIFDLGQAPPAFSAAAFSSPTVVDNPYFPLTPGETLYYRATTPDGEERIEYEVTHDTKVVAGVECVVVNDRVYVEGRIVEDTFDWFAQDDAGNVWYMGEEVTNHEYDDEGNPLPVTHEGSWEAGVDGAEPGINMFAAPVARTSYRQEYLQGEAEDMGFVIRTDASIELSDGTTYDDCVQTLDWVPLDAGAVETKYWAPGVGLVYSTHVDLTGEAEELFTP